MGSYVDNILGGIQKVTNPYGGTPGLHSQADDMAATLAIMNQVRRAHGLAPLESMPTAVEGNTAECLYARGFGDIAPVSVGGDANMRFADTERGRSAAAMIAMLTRGKLVNGCEVECPPMFRRVISAFDRGEFTEFNDTSY